MSPKLAGKHYVPMALAVLTSLIAAVAPSHGQTGALEQLEGLDGCWRDDGSSGCSDANALYGPRSVAVSPDGRNVYACAYDVVVTFARDDATGAITQLAAGDGCNGYFSPCGDGEPLLSTEMIEVSPQGNHVYVSSRDHSAITNFARNAETGVLTQPNNNQACISEGYAGCTVAHTLASPRGFALDKRGDHMYVAAETDNAIAVLQRNGTTGGLTQLASSGGCIRDTDGGAGACAIGRGLASPYAVVVARDGRNVYAVSPIGDSIAVLERDKSTGALTQPAGADGCANVTGTSGCGTVATLNGARDVALSKDGKFVYVVARDDDSITTFSRDRKTGVLSFLSCIREGGGSPCTSGSKLDGASHVRLSRDGKSLYVASEAGNSVAIFSRDRKTGALAQLPDLDGCLSADGSGPCVVGRAMITPSSIAIDARGDNVYIAGRFSESIGIYERARK